MHLISSPDINLLPRTSTGVTDLDPSWLNVDAKRFQFKSGGDKYGVTERLQGVSIFDTGLCGIIIVWQSKDNNLFIVDGHQRMSLAIRARLNGQLNDIFLPARIYKEIDGVSVEDVKVIAAFKNIAEGTGSSTDVARVIRQHGELPVTIPPKSSLVRQARSLAKLSEKFFTAVCSEVLKPEYGAVIAQALDSCDLDDSKRSEMEEAIFKAFCNPSSKPSSELEAQYIAKEVIRTGIIAVSDQNTLFDMEEVDNLLKERAEILTTAQNILQGELGKTKFMVRDEEQINHYIVGTGKLDRERLKSRHDDLVVARVILETGWKYREIGNSLSSSALKLNGMKQKPTNHPEIVSFIRMLDGTLSLSAYDLRAAKMKGDSINGEITKIRASLARDFLERIEYFLVESDIARALRGSLGSEIQRRDGQSPQSNEGLNLG